MPVDLVMPQLGLTMTEGKLLRWLKQVGETFETGEPLFEVETDKVNLEVEATEAGTLVEASPPNGELVPVATVIGCYLRKTEAAARCASAVRHRRAPVPPPAGSESVWTQ